MIDKWYKEALGCIRATKFSSIKSKSVLYKGFKIILDLETNNLELLDIRKTDFYSKPNDSDLKIFEDRGFIEGCNLIMFQRDKKRVDNYTKKLEKLYTQKDEYEKDSLKNKKRLGICNANIAETIDLLFFYKSRLNQNK